MPAATSAQPVTFSAARAPVALAIAAGGWGECVRGGLLLVPLLLAGCWCASAHRTARADCAAGQAALAEAALPQATVASVSAAAARASGDRRWQERNQVWLQVDTGAGFRWDRTGALLAAAPPGAEFRVRISPRERALAQELRN